MCCEQLVCANCAQPVFEARCAVCRAARADVHHAPGVSMGSLLALAAVLLLLAVVLQTTLGR